MVPAFGFSVGDFVQLIAFGASSEFQHVMLELGALQKILSQLAALTPNEHNAHHVNAIRGMALACQVPLQEFLVKIEHYEKTLGPWARTSLSVAAKKAKWAVFVAEDVVKFRALISAKIISINLLLCLQISETISTQGRRAGKRHNQLMMSIEMHRSKIDSLSKESREMRDDMIHSQRSTNRKISELKGDIESKLEKVSENTTRLAQSYNSMNLLLFSSRASFFCLRVLSAQVLNFLRAFPAEIRALLEKILRVNMQMYATLVRIQTQLASSPQFPGTENIVFEDGLGVVRELPYEWFKHWEVSHYDGLRHLSSQPGHFPGLVTLFRIVDAFWNMAYLRKEEGEEIEFYRNLGIHSTGKSHEDLLLATDGLALRLGFAVFREKALSSAHLDKPVPLIDWPHQIWNGEVRIEANHIAAEDGQGFSESN
ncbi:hypothetical protein HYALB_00001512 [Hymenoscyphus albidus]|uniref:Uncharacterized protein n=1 Tax=Hymenoscyphus albidus TaxID=595503 RepID=A0A9N9L914_9HELO|nr:hypothetical protein HYALB_00001512 [Hymenoscyphus albidus]